jgi:hypothetical protein
MRRRHNADAQHTCARHCGCKVVCAPGPAHTAAAQRTRGVFRRLSRANLRVQRVWQRGVVSQREVVIVWKTRVGLAHATRQTIRPRFMRTNSRVAAAPRSPKTPRRGTKGAQCVAKTCSGLTMACCEKAERRDEPRPGHCGRANCVSRVLKRYGERYFEAISMSLCSTIY